MGQPSTILGWGGNASGQATPPAGISDAIAVSAGGNHSLALRPNGTVIGWGFNPRVPPGLNSIMALASGGGHDLALRSNRTVMAWGDNGAGQSQVPAGLSNVLAVAAGLDHSLAVKTDGVVAAWGYFAGTNVPQGLSNIIAIAAGDGFSLAVRSDGTVVGWSFFGVPVPPPGLSNVVAVAAGRNRFSVALKSDGTVTAWGGRAQVQRDVPAGLSNVVAIAAGSDHALALKADGTVVAWGLNTFGPLNVPTTLRNAVGIAAGYDHSLALARSTPPPWPRITQHPQSLRALVGQAAKFSVIASSSAPLSYRWQYRGQNLSNETNASLELNDLTLSDSGDYAVIVSADGLSVRSAPTFLAVSNPPVATPQAVEGLEDTDLVITLDGVDPSGLPLVARIHALPAAGTLFQFDSGGRGAVIDTVPAFVTGPDWRIVYVPGAQGIGLAFDEFFFQVGNEIGDSLPARILINLKAVNDAPGFVKGPDHVSLEDAGRQVITHWAADVTAGPPNEVGQRLQFIVGNDNTALFAAPPGVEDDGTLTFTTAPNANGVATVTVRLEDDGGTDNGGVDISPAQTFTITVTPVNDSPVAQSQSVALDEDSSAAIALTASDVDVDTLAFTVALPAHGTLTGTAPNLFYRPAADYFGPDSFTFTVNDGQADSAPAIVNITVRPVNDAPLAVASASSPTALSGNDSARVLIIAPNNANAVVILDGSLSTDIEHDPLDYLWLVDGEPIPFGAGIRVTNRVEVGHYAVLLQVSDGTATATTPLTLEVIAPGEAVEMLILQVNTTATLRNNKRPLLASLKAAVASFDRGNIISGLNQLGAFQHKVRAQVARSDEALAETLIGETRQIIDLLNGARF